MEVCNLINNNGNATPNQFVVICDEHGENKKYFQSYNSVVCIVDYYEHKITFGKHWNYSKTPMQHLNTFLDKYAYTGLQGAKNIRKAIEQGEYNGYAVVYDDELI